MIPVSRTWWGDHGSGGLSSPEAVPRSGSATTRYGLRPVGRAKEGVRLLESTNSSCGVQEDATDDTSSLTSDESTDGGRDERREDTFEATIIQLDRDAAESLLRRAGL
jgi:hypothetical protein